MQRFEVEVALLGHEERRAHKLNAGVESRRIPGSGWSYVFNPVRAGDSEVVGRWMDEANLTLLLIPVQRY